MEEVSTAEEVGITMDDETALELLELLELLEMLDNETVLENVSMVEIWATEVEW